MRGQGSGGPKTLALPLACRVPWVSSCDGRVPKRSIGEDLWSAWGNLVSSREHLRVRDVLHAATCHCVGSSVAASGIGAPSLVASLGAPASLGTLGCIGWAQLQFTKVSAPSNPAHCIAARSLPSCLHIRTLLKSTPPISQVSRASLPLFHRRALWKDVSLVSCSRWADSSSTPSSPVPSLRTLRFVLRTLPAYP